MTRWKLTLEYDGRPFVGWQRQDNGPSVQAALERAVTAFCGETATLFAAGRTDAGVHATGQVAHVDIAKPTEAATVRDALNFHLRPDPVVVLSAEAAAADFHARFSATMRHYRYRILNRRTPPAIDRGRVWHVGVPLDPASMHAAAQLLVGKHDFTSFRAVACQSDSPVKTLDAISVAAAGEEVHLQVRARSFLHHQVRNIAGTLKLVGEGKWSADDVAAALAARDRSRAGPTAPPEGLYLAGVDY
jgi:tRNA pseudouridine38-40 synthase